jgi:hypothetical protein
MEKSCPPGSAADRMVEVSRPPLAALAQKMPSGRTPAISLSVKPDGPFPRIYRCIAGPGCAAAPGR